MKTKTGLISYKTVWHLAWPIILSNLSVPLLGAVDTAVIGHLPDPVYLGAVGIGAMIFSFLYWGFGFLKMGTTGFVSQAAGARDFDQIKTILAQALLLGGFIALLILLLQWPVLTLALSIIDPSDGVAEGASQYFYWRIWGAPATLANYALLGFFIGLGRTKTALVIQVLMNFINIILDLVFVVYLDMKVPGVAFATAISEWIGMLIGAIYLYRELTVIGGRWIASSIFNLQRIYSLMAVNTDIFIRTIILIFSFSYFTVAAAQLGDETLAAVTVAMNFVYFLAFGLDGFAHAAGILVGKAIGAKEPADLTKAVRASNVMAVSVAIGYALFYGLFGVPLVNLLTDIPSVRETAYSYLPWLVATPVIAVWSYQFDGIFVGAMKSREMRNGMIFSFVAYFVAIEMLQDWLHTDGLWIALLIFFAMRGLTLALVYPRVKKAAQ
ncbi:MATE family efflux transporter [Sneathiella sp.]|jgi:MATE family multidrug resistance protein|uniref:MATE family efflux transporter n=1 Tax=Sneathiella sp. TaxID=1964365 RepID=UPI0039E2C003